MMIPLASELIFVAGALVELCNSGAFGRVLRICGWKARLNHALAKATVTFRLWCRRTQVNCSQAKISTNTLSLYALTEAPFLKAKARNCIYVSEWLNEMCRKPLCTPLGRLTPRVLDKKPFDKKFGGSPRVSHGSLDPTGLHRSRLGCL